MNDQKVLDPDYILREQVKLPHGVRVADLGCGTQGFFSLAAAKIVGDRGQVYACDIIKDILSAVETKAKAEGLYNLKTVWTNLEIIGATKIQEPLDYDFLINTLFQSKKHSEMLKEAFRLLKPLGSLVLIEWKPSTGPIGPKPEMRVDKTTIQQLALEAGFNKTKEFEAGQHHYGFVFEKPA